MGVVPDASSILCNGGFVESHHHLFFECSYYRAVWLYVLGGNQVVRAPMKWVDEMAWFILHHKGNSFRKCVLKLSLSGNVCFSFL